MGTTLFFFAYDSDLPRIAKVSDYHPKVVTKILSSDGEIIGELFEERRTLVARERIPPAMIHALVDAEDAQFYEHSGLSYVGMLRALINDITPGKHLQGASTLTQQLVRNLILKSRAQTVKRKVQELILAKRIESALTKDEILYLYLNQIEFPYQRFGVEEAARFYFGKSIADVNPGEAALLASLPKGPSEIDPLKHPERAKDRQKYVLSQMVRYHHLSASEAEKYANQPIQLVRSATPYLGVAPEFVDQVKALLIQRYGAKRLYTLGLTVVTTCDARIQKLAREAVERQLVELDGRQGYRKPLRHLKPAARSIHLHKLAEEFPHGIKPGRIVEGVVSTVVVTPSHESDGLKVDLGAEEGWLPLPMGANVNERYNPKGLPVDKRFAVGDVLRVQVIESYNDKERPPLLTLELGPQAAAVVLDPNTRQVRAIVGGYGYRPGAFDHAIAVSQCLSKKSVAGCRQPGSSFKPFVYATAFASEKFTPATVLLDSPQVYVSPGLAPWKPENAEKEAFLGPVRLRTALARSLNTVASQLVDVTREGVDPAAVVQLAHNAGIEAELEPNPSLALGTSSVSLLEMVNAYATFDNGGRRMPTQLLLKVGDEDEPPATAQMTQAMRPELAYLITSVMTSVIEEGTAQAARGKLHRPAAGKTGTTNLKRKQPDAWFVGYTPDLVAGVWVGFDDMRDLGHGEQGARAALPIWIDIMNGALKNVPPKPFLQPPGVVVQRIDAKTGLLAPPNAPGIDEVFLDGTQPKTVAPAAGEANPDTYIIDQMQ